MEKRYTEYDIIALLALRHNRDSGWAFFPEFRTKTMLGSGETRIDAFAVGLYHENAGTVGYEVKVSRADFMHDVAQFVTKQGPALALCNQFYYVVPHGLVKVDEVPESCGLLYVNESGLLTRHKEAQRRTIEAFPLKFFQALANRAAEMNPKRENTDILRHFVGAGEFTLDDLDKYISHRIAKQKDKLEFDRREIREASTRQSNAEKMLDLILSRVMKIGPQIDNQYTWFRMEVDTPENREALLKMVVEKLHYAEIIWRGCRDMRSALNEVSSAVDKLQIPAGVYNGKQGETRPDQAAGDQEHPV